MTLLRHKVPSRPQLLDVRVVDVDRPHSALLVESGRPGPVLRVDNKDGPSDSSAVQLAEGVKEKRPGAATPRDVSGWE